MHLYLVEPPSTLMTCPFTKDAFSDARNNTTSAISSGLTSRFIALSLIIAAPALSSICFDMFVSVSPGAIAFTLIPRGANSVASVFVQEMTAAFDFAKRSREL